MKLVSRWRALFALALLGLFLLSVFWEKTIELKVVKIGVIAIGESRLGKLDGLKKGLADLGYSEENLQFMVFDAGERAVRLPWMAEMMLAEEPDIIVTLGTLETLVVQEQMKVFGQNVPVVFVGIAAPIEQGLIIDYQHPGGLFTGVHHPSIELSAKRLEMLTELIPGLEKVAILYSSQLEVSQKALAMVQLAARQFNLYTTTYDFDEPGIINRLETELTGEEALLSLPGYPMEILAPEIATLALKLGLPTMGILDQDARIGYLFSYGPSAFGLGYQASRQVSALLKGVHPSLIPVEFPDTIQLMVNPDTQERLKFELEVPLIRMAREVSLTANGWLSGEGYD